MPFLKTYRQLWPREKQALWPVQCVPKVPIWTSAHHPIRQKLCQRTPGDYHQFPKTEKFIRITFDFIMMSYNRDIIWRNLCFFVHLLRAISPTRSGHRTLEKYVSTVPAGKPSGIPGLDDLDKELQDVSVISYKCTIKLTFFHIQKEL